MSLSQRGKDALKFAIEGPQRMLGERAGYVMVKLGPVVIVDTLIRKTQHTDAAAELSENREEAEKYVAGLLGMM